MAGRRLAAPPKKARNEKAPLVFIDESGFFLNPLVRRTWAPRGKTPLLRRFGRHRDKVSTVAALIMLGLAVVLALLLDQSKGFFAKVCRTIFFLPYGIPTAIGALIWGYLYSPNLSPFNQVLAALHANTINFLSPALVLFSIANVVTWTWTGYNMITLFAALQGIPHELYEAASMDGASRWDTVRYIKLPLLLPTLKLLFIFSVIGTSQLFTEAFVLRPLGYVADNITPNLYLYLTAARDANYSYSGALATLLQKALLARHLVAQRQAAARLVFCGRGGRERLPQFAPALRWWSAPSLG